jgi:hypothetical protein
MPADEVRQYMLVVLDGMSYGQPGLDRLVRYWGTLTSADKAALLGEVFPEGDTYSQEKDGDSPN